VIITMIIGLSASVITVLAFFGSTWWVLDFLANYRWQLMWIALLCAIIYALSARGIAALVFLGAVVINGFVLSPMWFGSQPAATGEGGVTVVSLDMFGSTSDEDRVLQWLFDTDADVIIVSGVAAGRLDPLTADGSPYEVIASPEPDTSGICIIAKENYTVTVEYTPSTAEPVYTVSVPSGNDVVSLITAWGEVAKSSSKAQALSERLGVIGSLVEARTGPVAVVGSIGTTRFTSGMRSLLASSGLRDASEGSGYLSTTPVSTIPIIGGWIGIPLDVALMTADITPLDLATGPDVGVGHLPLSLTIGPSAQG
jgi:hypothetical protein